MHKDKEQLTTGSKALLFLLEAGHILKQVGDLGKMQRALYPEYAQYRAQQNFNQLLRRLIAKGWIKTECKLAQQVIKLTKKGQLEALLQKSFTTTQRFTSAGHWTLATFDIPEAARNIRTKLRKLLKTYGFYPIQASVYINPRPVTPEGIQYLKETKLIKYIRFFTVIQAAGNEDLERLLKLPVLHGRAKQVGATYR
ncbi:MAG: CRISPR-associated endonuclease Cas2 [Candidatus Doudnabacteria bacterium]|nr:CRISPR-associated endonuclease Cas2 [Candidatus Doudnabacteria bacterium]